MMPSFRSLVPIVAFAVIYAAISLTITNSYYQLMMTLVLVWAVFGLSWNLLSGYTGLISFGHAAFFGIGAYTTALGQIYFDLSPWMLIPIAAMLGGVAGLLVGFPTFRLQGHYFALAMLAYPLAILYVFEWLGYQELTLPIKRDNPIAYMQFSDTRVYTLLALAILVGTVAADAMDRADALWDGAAGDQTERGRGGGRRYQHAGMEAARHYAQRRHRRRDRRLLRHRAAGRDPAIGVRHAGVRASPDGRDVRRRRHGLGTGDRLRHPDPAGGNPQRRGRHALSRHSGRDLWTRHRLRDPAGAGRTVLESPRSPAQAERGGAAGNRGTARSARCCRRGFYSRRTQAGQSGLPRRRSCSKCAACRAPSAA